jgi:hypothetical protein
MCCVTDAHGDKQSSMHADELTVHGEHDVKTWMQQDLKRERPGAPPPVGKSLQAQQARHVFLKCCLLRCEAGCFACMQTFLPNDLV